MDNIFEGMSQFVHDQFCMDDAYKKILDEEDDRIGTQKLNEVKQNAKWMTVDEFTKYLQSEIKRKEDELNNGIR